MEMFTGLLSGSMLSALLKGGALLTAVFVIPMLVKLFLVTVDEGSAAIRTRNGRPIIRRPRGAPRDHQGDVVVLRPGTHGAVPIFYWYRMVDVRTRSTDLPPRQLTAASGHQHLVHASFDWRPLTTGHDLRVIELDVVNVKERAGNIVGAAMRDIVHELHGPVLPPNESLSPAVVATCRDRVRESCGIELLSVVVTGDALTDGYLMSESLRAAGGAGAEEWVPVAAAASRFVSAR
ncbi:MAG: hypothetical protein J0J11_08200 [Microbacterium sp.]|nr:hypothetical protein [Microbacterium sp.]